MGKKNHNKKIKKLAQKLLLKKDNLPLVSLCTPTYNRRPFMDQCIRNMLNQTYPHDKLEWVIIDDGIDKIGDLVEDISFVKYIALDERISLGKKRNMLHNTSTGGILIYIDDDDYYPPDRVMHAVTELLKSKKLIAGSSELYVAFEEQDIYKFGPYGINHATAGTFAFKRELLNNTQYQEEAYFAEEKHFLNNYTIPLIQLDPFKTMLVFNHAHNTINKRKFIVNGDTKYVKKTDYKYDKFKLSDECIEFYSKTLHEKLATYDLGLPKHKPEVMDALTKKYADMNRENTEAQKHSPSENSDNPNQLYMIDKNGNKNKLSNSDIIQLYKKQKEVILEHESTIRILTEKLENQGKILEDLKNK